MAPPGDVYERELKSLLTGDQKAIAKMVKTCDAMEKANYQTMLTDPFMVIRAAGSLGVDLVALRWDFSFPIEVKSSGDSVLHFSKNQHLTEQADIMLNARVQAFNSVMSGSNSILGSIGQCVSTMYDAALKESDADVERIRAQQQQSQRELRERLRGGAPCAIWLLQQPHSRSLLFPI